MILTIVIVIIASAGIVLFLGGIAHEWLRGSTDETRHYFGIED